MADPINLKTNQIRVGIFSYDYIPWEGGVGRCVWELKRHMDIDSNSNVESIIFSPCSNNLTNHHRIFKISKFLGKNLLFSFFLNIFICGIIKKYNLDIVHIHGGAGGILLFRRIPLPVIITAHTNNYLFQYRHLKILSKKLLYRFEKRSFDLADSITVVSSYIRSNLIRDYGVSDAKIHVISNGVAHEVFHPIRVESPLPSHIILYAGRIDKRKGIVFLIEAMAEVFQQRPDVCLWIAGSGGRYMHKVETLIRQKSMNKYIRFLGFQNSQQLNKLYNMASVCVLPSVIEGFGLTILEAMACGCPVIASDSGGAIDIIRHGENGYLVTYGDTSQLAALILQLIEDETLRSRFETQGKTTAITRFTWKKMARNYIRLYESLSGMKSKI